MDMLRIRITGPRSNVEQLIELLGETEGVEGAEVIDDLMPHFDDDNSSSAGLAETEDETAVVEIEAEASTLQRARETALEGARIADLAVEIVEEF